MKKFKMKNKYISAFVTTLLTTSLISACDSTLSLNAIRGDSSKIPEISANLTALATGSSLVRIPDLSFVPDDIKNSDDIQVAFDNSKVLYPVTKNSDGSLSFPLSSSVRIDSAGNFNAIFVINNQKSYIVKFKTGPLLKLKSPAVLLKPETGTIVKGEKFKLNANITDDAKDKFVFNWYYGSSASGPFFSISGTSDSVEWTPNTVGSFFIKFDMLNKSTGISSSYVSPVALAFVTDANNIISVSPSSNVLRGKQTTLTANIPNVDPGKYDFTWSYGASAQGPFVAISGNTKTVNWTPVASGSFYIKVDAVNRETKTTSSFNTTEPVVFVTENENIITTQPSLGNIIRGSSVKLEVNVPNSASDASYVWSYSQSPAGPWQSITGALKTVDWTPSITGSFYIKTDIIDNKSNSVSTFISPKAIVFVNEAGNIFKIDPIAGNIKRGSFVNITADVPGATGKNFQYNWSYSSSLLAPFQPLSNSKGDLKSNTIRWRPATEGSYYVKVDAVNLDNQSVLTFTSSSPIVFVNELTPLFRTSPEIARITSETSVDIMVALEATMNSVYTWSYSTSQVGPWTSIGASTTNTITWETKKIPGTTIIVSDVSGKPVPMVIPASTNKPPGTYYIKVDIQDPSDNTIASFVSRTPIIFIDKDSTTSNASIFGGAGQ